MIANYLSGEQCFEMWKGYLGKYTADIRAKKPLTQEDLLLQFVEDFRITKEKLGENIKDDGIKSKLSKFMQELIDNRQDSDVHRSAYKEYFLRQRVRFLLGASEEWLEVVDKAKLHKLHNSTDYIKAANNLASGFGYGKKQKKEKKSYSMDEIIDGNLYGK
jgi:hypothetical protein